MGTSSENKTPTHYPDVKPYQPSTSLVLAPLLVYGMTFGKVQRRSLITKGCTLTEIGSLRAVSVARLDTPVTPYAAKYPTKNRSRYARVMNMSFMETNSARCVEF
jgi:hypothetical protein